MDDPIQQKIIESTGVDLLQYKTDELLGSISSLLLFPQFVWVAFLVPTLLLFALFAGVAAVLFYMDFGAFGIVFSIFGLISSVVTGAIIGTVRLSNRMMIDLKALLTASLELIARIAEDIQSRALPGKPAPLPSLSEMIKTSNALTFIPLIDKVLHARIPLLGGWMSWMIEKAFHLAEKHWLSRQETVTTLATPQTISEHTRVLYFQQVADVARRLEHKTNAAIVMVRRFLIRPMNWGMWLAIIGNGWVLLTAILALWMAG